MISPQLIVDVSFPSLLMHSTLSRSSEELELHRVAKKCTIAIMTTMLPAMRITMYFTNTIEPVSYIVDCVMLIIGRKKQHMLMTYCIQILFEIKVTNTREHVLAYI